MHHRMKPSAGLRARLLGTSAVIALAAALNVVPSSDADAAGFALKEQSATALGNAFAGATAGAEDVSYMFFNPAGLTRHDGNQAAVALSYIAPIAETSNAVDGTATFTNGVQDGAVDAVLPAIYGMWSFNSDLKFAVGINVPLGLSTEYDANWAGAFHAIDSELQSININPAVAYRVNEMVSIGAGIQIQQFEATLTNFDGVGIASVTGDDWGFGFNLGALVEFSPETRLGASYRSQVEHTLDGTANVPSAALVNAGITADFTAPDSASIGLYHDINDQWAVMGELGWMGWSSFDQLQVVLDAGIPLTTTPENWEDVFFYAVGATWKPNEKWTLRGGLAFDESPIPDATRTPRLPGNDRTWVALGAQFHPSPNFTVDTGYTHIFVDDANISLTAPAPFTATFEGSIDILTVQGTFRF